VLKYFSHQNETKNQKSGDGTLLEYKFEVFMQFLCISKTKILEKQTKNQQILRGKTITAPTSPLKRIKRIGKDNF